MLIKEKSIYSAELDQNGSLQAAVFLGIFVFRIF